MGKEILAEPSKLAKKSELSRYYQTELSTGLGQIFLFLMPHFETWLVMVTYIGPSGLL